MLLGRPLAAHALGLRLKSNPTPNPYPNSNSNSYPNPNPYPSTNQVYASSGFGYFRGEPINLKPKSGEGPPGWLLKEGAFTIEVTATAASGAKATATVKGKGDPGYGATVVPLEVVY